MRRACTAGNAANACNAMTEPRGRPEITEATGQIQQSTAGQIASTKEGRSGNRERERATKQLGKTKPLHRQLMHSQGVWMNE